MGWPRAEVSSPDCCCSVPMVGDAPSSIASTRTFHHHHHLPSRPLECEEERLPVSKRARHHDAAGDRRSPSSAQDMLMEYTCEILPHPMPSKDEVLVEMIRQSGATTYGQVIEFCKSVGIPLSRMLRLDLMRQANHTN